MPSEEETQTQAETDCPDPAANKAPARKSLAQILRDQAGDMEANAKQLLEKAQVIRDMLAVLEESPGALAAMDAYVTALEH
jgi:hypothetical protein